MKPIAIPSWPPDWAEIRDSVAECLRRGDWGRYRGLAVKTLQDQIRQMTQRSFCRLVSSGSVGVEWALRSLGIGPGDEVVVCAYDYPGNLRAIELLGARPVLVDADPAGFSLSADGLRKLPPENVKAVIVSHLYGVPAKIAAINDVCRQRNWRLVEDACQVPGMVVDDAPAGSWGDVSVLSFGGSKPLTAGNGGAMLTGEPAIEARWRSALDRPSDAIPMSELQAAALLPQLQRLETCNQTRAQTAQQIVDRVGWMRERVVLPEAPSRSTFYKLALLSDDRDERVQACQTIGLSLGAGYRSMHRTSDRRCRKADDLSRAERLGAEVCLLDHAVLLAEGDVREALISRLMTL